MAEIKKAVVVLSGGMDSATALYQAKADGNEVYAVSFNYGQKHKKELDFARQLAEKAGVKEHKVVDLTDINQLVSHSALTGKDIAVPDGHYTAESMKITVVPNRNMIMYAVALGYAVNLEADAMYVGIHSGDHAIYPDCRPDFITGLQALALVANEGFIKPDFEIKAPFVNISKAEIAAKGNKLGVPYELTWSCYKGGDKHCGTCGTCVERVEAFQLASVIDPTVYESS